MGLLDALNIGGNALLTHQAAIQVTGNNIANMATPGYARQQAVLAPHGSSRFGPGLSAGGGVKLAQVRRIVDDALQQRLNDAGSQMQQYQVADTALRRIESLMNELTDTDLSSGMVDLFNSFSALAADSASLAARDIVVTRAETLVGRFGFIGQGLGDIQNSLTEQLEGAIVEADSLAATIANLNVEVVNTESGGGSAASLRDQRDRAITQLSEMISVSVREETNGSVNVFIGSEMLVTRGSSRGISLVGHTPPSGGTPVPTVSFADNGGAVELSGGVICGLQTTRDGELAEVANRMDTLAKQLIWEVNRLHSSGSSLEGFTEITGVQVVEDADAALTSVEAGLAFTPVNGSFNIIVSTSAADGTVTSSTTQINVPLTGSAADMTLNDLIASLGAVTGVSAAHEPSGLLKIETTGPNTEIRFSEDTSGILAAMGINTFFTGDSAATMGVNQTIVDNRRHIAAGLTGADGDGDNAMRIADLASDTQRIGGLGGRSLLQYQQEIVTDVAVWANAARDTAASNGIVFDSLTAQRESLSGVSIDEEAVNLMQYQRAFQGAARFLSVVDELLDIMMRIV